MRAAPRPPPDPRQDGLTPTLTALLFPGPGRRASLAHRSRLGEPSADVVAGHSLGEVAVGVGLGTVLTGLGLVRRTLDAVEAVAGERPEAAHA